MSFIRATLRSSAVETYRINGLRRKRVTAGGVVTKNCSDSQLCIEGCQIVSLFSAYRLCLNLPPFTQSIVYLRKFYIFLY